MPIDTADFQAPLAPFAPFTSFASFARFAPFARSARTKKEERPRLESLARPRIGPATEMEEAAGKIAWSARNSASIRGIKSSLSEFKLAFPRGTGKEPGKEDVREEGERSRKKVRERKAGGERMKREGRRSPSGKIDRVKGSSARPG